MSMRAACLGAGAADSSGAGRGDWWDDSDETPERTLGRVRTLTLSHLFSMDVALWVYKQSHDPCVIGSIKDVEIASVFARLSRSGRAHVDAVSRRGYAHWRATEIEKTER